MEHRDTMVSDSPYFYELYEGLPRAGPGDPASTRRAYSYLTNLPKHPYIVDIGCGPGMQTIELARISNRTVVALDTHQPFLDALLRTARATGVADRIRVKNLSMRTMDFDEGSFDIAWSEGALYIMGFQNGLRACRRLLRSGGYAAVTEAVFLTSDRPDPVTQFWEREYPDIRNVPTTIETIEKTGFRLAAHFTLPKSAWMDYFYTPIERRIEELAATYRDNAEALQVFGTCLDEIEVFKRYSNYFGYEFFIMQKE